MLLGKKNGMKIVAILRIKNEILVAEKCLSKLSELVDEIIILDNGSTDGTENIYAKFPKISKILRTVGYDEGRDKTMLLDEAKKTKSDWILWIDGDEVFENSFSRKVIEKYMNSGYSRIYFRMFNFWLSYEKFRIDGANYLYTLHPQRSMWRNVESAYFINTKMHNGDIQGITGKTYISPYRLKHYGYADGKKMKEKYDRYLLEDKTGKRDYSHLDPSQPYKSVTFKEYDNNFVSILYIYSLKYVCQMLWIAERLRLKMVRFFK